MPIAFSSAVQLSLDTDGTLLAFGGVDPLHPGTRSIVIAAPAATSVRAVTVMGRPDLRAARLAGGRIVIATLARGANALTDTALQVVRRDGRVEKTLMSGVAAYGPGVFSFDGRDVAATVNQCNGALLVRTPLASAYEPPSRRACRLGLARRPRWSPSGLRVAISCRGLQFNCGAARVTARLGGARGRMINSVTDRGRELTIPVARKQRDVLAARSRRIWIRATVVDGAGQTTRVATVTVAAR